MTVDLSKFLSRKFLVTVFTIGGVALGKLPFESIYPAIAYMLGQGAVDAAGRLRKP